MKQTLLSLLMIMLPMVASAVAVEINGIWYNLDATNQTAEVTYNNGGNSYSGNITIPSSVNYDNIDYNVTSIGESAFKGCTTLESISLPSTILTIGASAFIDCSSLDDFTIPNSVKSIGNSAFYGCSGFTSIEIPNGVTSIGSYAFAECSLLASINIPSSITFIDDAAFEGTPWEENLPEGMTYLGKVAYRYIGEMPANTSLDLNDGIVQIVSRAFTGCSGLSNITIPDGVTSIGVDAFGDCSGLTSINLPSSLTTIGYSAFRNCSNLQSIVIPAGVESIVSKTFAGCTNLSSLILSDGIKNINTEFYGCTSLTSLSIPQSVITFNCQFDNHDNHLEKLIVDANNQIYDSRNNCNAIIETATNKLIAGCNNTVIPSTVTAIGNHAFSGCSGLANIIIPDDVTSIGNYSFYNCSNLATITIPDGVTTIGHSAFEGCSGLISLTIPNSVTDIGSWAFKGCSGLELLIIGSGVENIGYGVFSNCTSLIDVFCLAETVPSTEINAFPSSNSAILHVPQSAYYQYTNNSSWWNFVNIMTIEEGIPQILIDGIKYNLNIVDGMIAEVISNSSLYVGNVVIPESVTYNNMVFSVTSIGNSAFSGCSGLTDLTIPNSVTSIGKNALQNCIGLTSITIPDGVTSIGNSAFEGCSGLTSINIPNGVTFIGSSAFSGCSGLTSIAIPEGVSTIGNSVFKNCNGLTSVTIPDGVQSIGNYAFQNCSGLTSITLPKDVTSIGVQAFSWCSGLTNINIPEGVTYIGGSAFMYSGLTSITIPNSVSSIDDNTFYICDNLTNITIPESVTSIGDFAFYWCSNLTNITIPDGVTSIGSHAFSGCSKFNSIELPISITSIGESSFEGCSGLTNITIPNGITFIPDGAFSGCSNLSTVTLPNQLNIIRSSAFSSCSKLESISIPASVEYIYQNTFSGCTSLEVINVQPTTPPFIYNNTFPDYAVPVNVPSGCAEAYSSHSVWGNFTTINDGNVYYQLAITSNSHGKATYGGKDVRNTTTAFDVQEGSNAAITITADAGYQIATATVNDVDVMSSIVNGVLTLTNVTANAAIVLTFSGTSDHTTVTIGSTGMATYCPMDDVDFSTVSGLKAYTATGYDHGTLTVSRVLNAPAGTGLLLQGEAGSYDVPYATSTGYYINLLHGLMTDTQVSPTEGSYTNFILGQKSGVTTFYRLSEAGAVAAGKAYLQLPTSVVDDGSSSRVMRIVAEDETTGIRSVELLTNSEGVNSEELFDLQGRRVAKPSKGIYIVGGQKVVVK